MRKVTLDVAVVGGGPAGLATAIALMTLSQRERLELRVTVFDKPVESKTNRPDPRAIELWRNAYDALSRINTGKPLSETDDTRFFGEVGYALERYDFRSTNGSVLWSLPAGAIGRKMEATPKVVTLKQIRQRLQDRWDKIVVGIPVIEESLKAWKGLDVLLVDAKAANDQPFVNAVRQARTDVKALVEGHLMHELRLALGSVNAPTPEANKGRREIVKDRFFAVLEKQVADIVGPVRAAWDLLNDTAKHALNTSTVPPDYKPDEPNRRIDSVEAGLLEATKLAALRLERGRRAGGGAETDPKDLEPAGHDIISADVTEVLWSPGESVALISTTPRDPLDPGSKADMKFDLVIGTDSRSSVVYRDARLWSERYRGGERLFGDPKHARARSSVMAIAGVAGLNEADAASERANGQTVRVPGRDLVEPGVGFVIHGPNVRLGAWPCPEAEDSATRWLLFLSRDAIFPLVEDGAGPHGGEDARDAMIQKANERFANDPDPETKDKLEKKIRDANKKVRDRIDDALKPLPKTARDLVKNTKTDKISLYSLEDRRSNKAHWVAGRVMLLGDAAHPSLPDLGQACAMAFEDAAALAVWIRKLAYEDDGLPDQSPEGEARLIRALCGWRDERFPRVAKIVEATRIASEAAHGGKHVPETMRDLAIAYLGPAVIGAGVESWVNPHGAR